MANKSEQPYIGSYVLETLTTGMYGESENALREYVQNAFDAVQAATRLGVLNPTEGRIEVLLLNKNTLSIRDNGVGIAQAAAWGTLTSIGASKKDRATDAGFRGIGRLAGIAFCDKLIFRTKAAEESVETTVTFDCLALRKGMNPDEDGGGKLVDLLTAAIGLKTTTKCVTAEHYMEVTLTGLDEAPATFKDIDSISHHGVTGSPALVVG